MKQLGGGLLPPTITPSIPILYPFFYMNNQKKIAMIKQIDRPWHSRPIDVHKWSDHPEVRGYVDQIWQRHFVEDGAATKKPGPKPKTAFKNQLRVVILDLYVAWLEDPSLCIGISMSPNAWDTNSRYNALHISKRVIPIVARLREVGLIDLSTGSYAGPNAPGNRTTRIRASEELVKWFEGNDVPRDAIVRADQTECIILKDGDEAGDGSKLHEYEDTDQTVAMREELRAYNRVLADSFIDIPTLDDPFIETTVNSGPEKGSVKRQPTDHHHKFVRRIFSRGDWGLNGRFYGGWWQQINSEWRNQIFINDTPAVEVDFDGIHVSILSLKRGVVLEGDPYALPDGLVPGTPPVLQRKLVKMLVLTAINARSIGAAYRSFRDGFPTGHMGKTLTNEDLGRLLDAFVHLHPHLKDAIGADQGIRLMNVDSQIAERVHRHFTVQGVPVLSVHDSYIIDYTRVGELKAVMAAASAEVVGFALPASNKFFGIDEMQGDDPDIMRDYIWWRQAPRSPGYLERLAAHEARTEREVVPY